MLPEWVGSCRNRLPPLRRVASIGDLSGLRNGGTRGIGPAPTGYGRRAAFRHIWRSRAQQKRPGRKFGRAFRATATAATAELPGTAAGGGCGQAASGRPSGSPRPSARALIDCNASLAVLTASSESLVPPG